ncbi:MAG TPA: response regulator [Thermoanaerobaculia bacterium]|jgi:DNA-binding response OmpR family regulator|nr:response regulator [Thermoanaerobaculia bacterium]
MDLPQKHRILIVDDDPGIRCLLVAYLRREGFQMLEACNGRQALEEMRAGNADLVILDLMMPEVSGMDVLCERAADTSLRQIPVIVVSANVRREVTAAVLGQDIRAVIAKPFDLDALLAIVTTCLEEPPHVPTSVAA